MKFFFTLPLLLAVTFALPSANPEADANPETDYGVTAPGGAKLVKRPPPPPAGCYQTCNSYYIDCFKGCTQYTDPSGCYWICKSDTCTLAVCKTCKEWGDC